jgi:hypothetical protein
MQHDMKKITLLIFVISIFSYGAKAQKIRANAYGAYVFDDSFESYYSDYVYYHGKIKGGFRGGIGLEYMMRPTSSLEVLWVHQSTTAPTTYRPEGYFAEQRADLDLNLDYIMLAGQSYIRNADGAFEGYGGLMAGMAIVGAENPNTGGTGSATKFAWGARLGANIWVTPRIGIKLQADLLSIVQGAGGGLYFGTGGAGAGISTYSTMYQFGLGGGLTFKIGASSPKAAPAPAPAQTPAPAQAPVKQ